MGFRLNMLFILHDFHHRDCNRIWRAIGDDCDTELTRFHAGVIGVELCHERFERDVGFKKALRINTGVGIPGFVDVDEMSLRIDEFSEWPDDCC